MKVNSNFVVMSISDFVKTLKNLLNIDTKQKDCVRDSTLTLQRSHQKKIILRLVTWLTHNTSIELWNFTSEAFLLFFSFLFMLESLYIVNHNYWMKLSYTTWHNSHHVINLSWMQKIMKKCCLKTTSMLHLKFIR